MAKYILVTLEVYFFSKSKIIQYINFLCHNNVYLSIPYIFIHITKFLYAIDYID